MKTLLCVLALTSCVSADALVFRANYDRGFDVVRMRGTAILSGESVTKARLKWHGPNWSMLGSSGTWDGTDLDVSGLGCLYDPHFAACGPSTQMIYSSVTGLEAAGEAVSWPITGPFIVDQVPIGDSNLDGLFDSADLVKVFAAGEYEDNYLPDGSFNENGYRNSIWRTGDWNLDLEFDSADLVSAFGGGAYNAPAVAVPELDGIGQLVYGFTFLILVIGGSRTWHKRRAMESTIKRQSN